MADNFNILDFNETDDLRDALASAVALGSFTNSTGQTPDSTIENIPAATAAPVDMNAASLTSTNTALTAVERCLADLAGKVNSILTALDI